MQIADVQKPVLPRTEIDECGLDRPFDIHHFAFVDAANIGRSCFAFGEVRVESLIRQDCDATFVAWLIIDH